MYENLSGVQFKTLGGQFKAENHKIKCHKPVICNFKCTKFNFVIILIITKKFIIRQNAEQSGSSRKQMSFKSGFEVERESRSLGRRPRPKWGSL